MEKQECSCKKSNKNQAALSKLFPSLQNTKLKSKSNKNAGKSAAKKECMKDVFLIPSPKISKVPLKLKRQCYYKEGLVALAFTFDSNMSETDLRCAIAVSFHEKFPVLPNFSFVKPVEKTLVECNLEEWNFKTIKHVFGQGPIYIRVIGKALPQTKLVIDEEDLEEMDLDDDQYEDDRTECSKNVGDRLSADSKRRKIDAFDSCPICSELFPLEVLETHTARCALKFDLIGDECIEIQNNDDTIPYEGDPPEDGPRKDSGTFFKILITPLN